MACEPQPVGEDMEVTLPVFGLPAGTKTVMRVASAGVMIVKGRTSIAETGCPPLGTWPMDWRVDRIEFVLPACTRSERWPLETRGSSDRSQDRRRPWPTHKPPP